jgi:predicted metal-dependent phosphoesterase TrpH
VTFCLLGKTYNALIVIIDLHTHTTASDGILSPVELLRHAHENDVDILAITDHDTLDAFKQLNGQASKFPELIAGVELSTAWRGCGIHVLGLNVDVSNDILRRGIERQKHARLKRAETIAQRLTKLGIDNPLRAVRTIAGNGSVGRPHFAKHLVDIGFVRDLRTAFRKYLAAGKPGDVNHCWASMQDVVAWILAAGGIPVVAHPAKYRFTMTKLRCLLDDFKATGGQGIEVICGHQTTTTTQQLANLAKDLELLASCGSDFHQPGLPWSRPGGFAPLPDSLRKVWDAW